MPGRQFRSTWDGFGSHRGSSDAKRELAEALQAVQHGLCGYCEMDLHDRDREVEHVVPRSDSAHGPELALDHSNLIACCRGGTSPDLSEDAFRFIRPIRANRSCGQAKGDSMDGDFLDPRALPCLPSLFRVLSDGEITPDCEACRDHNVDVARVKKTISMLGLNVPRLKRAREEHWKSLAGNWHPDLGDAEKLRAAARGELLPGEAGELSKFFTTTRSFFGPLAESILGETAPSWV